LLTKLYYTFFLNKYEEILLGIFNKDKDKNTTKDLKILVQTIEDIYYYTLFGTIIKSLNKSNNIQVEQYVPRNLTLGATSTVSSFLKSILLNNRFRDNKWIKLYSTYSDSVAYKHEGSTSLIFNIKSFFKAYKIFKSIKYKNDLILLSIDNINVGDLIYDSYLRFKPSATVKIDDFYLCIILWQTIRNIKVTKDYFNKNKPDVLLTSYGTYIQHGIAVRIAVLYNTKVYSFGNYQNYSKQLDINDTYHTANFKNYKNDFNKLENKENYLDKSREALNGRINGKKDLATSYMKQSAYKVSNEKMPNVKDKIIIFMHDFFDSPHIYGDMVFSDFLEWIEFTIETLERYNIPYCLKPHPNQIKDSEKAVQKLKQKYPNTQFISSKITNKQLVNGNIKVGISLYGSVAHELVYMGVPVILSGANPHSSYDFCFEAKNKNEYENYIKNYMDLSIPIDYKKQIESFYYMHNLNKSDDEIVLNRILGNLRKINVLKSEKDLSYVKEQMDLILKNKAFKSFNTNLLGEV